MFKNNRVLIIIGTIIAILAIILIVVTLKGRQKSGQVGPKEVNQTQLSDTVIIDNTDKLNSILLPEQYGALIDDLSSYIRTTIGSQIDHASVVGDATVRNDGILVFTIKTDNPASSFEVRVDRHIYGQITISIPKTSYTHTIQVFGSSGE